MASSSTVRIGYSPAHATTPRRRYAFCLGLIIAGIAVLAFFGQSTVLKGYPDFEYFNKAGAWLLAHGGLDLGYDIDAEGRITERDTLKWYLPFVSRFMTLFSWMDLGSAGIVWLSVNLFATFGTFALLGRVICGQSRRGPLSAWSNPSLIGLACLVSSALVIYAAIGIVGRFSSAEASHDLHIFQLLLLVLTLIVWYWEFRHKEINAWPILQVLPFVLTIMFWYWEFRLNQINVLTMFFLVVSFAAWIEQRRFAAGFLVGIATLLKVSPALFIVWFLLKREWRTAGAALVTIALAGPVSDIVVWGPEQTATYYSAWLTNVSQTGSNRGLILSEREMDFRNQSLCAGLTRWLHHTSYALRFDNDPRFYIRRPPAFFNIADIPLDRVALIATAVSAFIGLAFVILARQPARLLTLQQLRLEWALCFLVVLLLMPVLRRYHLIWTMPALSVLVATTAVDTRRTTALLIPLGATLFTVSQLATTTPKGEAMGILLFGVFLLAITLAILRASAPKLNPNHAAPPVIT